MELETVLSSRGNKLLIHNGFKYFAAHENKEGIVRWRCGTKGCGSKIYTDKSHSQISTEHVNILEHSHAMELTPAQRPARDGLTHVTVADDNTTASPIKRDVKSELDVPCGYDCDPSNRTEKSVGADIPTKPKIKRNANLSNLQCPDISTSTNNDSVAVNLNTRSYVSKRRRIDCSIAGLWRGRKADMEVALPGPLALDCEDMFKEITKKLYGEEGALEMQEREHDEGSMLKPEDHITAFGLAALMQNGFPPPGILHANFQPKTNPAAEDKWTPSDEGLQWTASRIASYNPAQKLFKCIDCECVGFLSRVAEHWLGTHSNARVFQCPQCAYGSAWARCVRLHLVREHSMPDDRGTDALVKNNPVLDEVTKYLQRLKAKVDGQTPAPAVVAPPPPQVRPPAPSPPAAAAAKRYSCPACPYATDRRDLYTRHENIHRDEKPFECYVCQKQFNRADHVKKHFLRMHRDHPYDLNRIRRQLLKSPPTNNYYPKIEMPQNNSAGPPEQVYSVRPPIPKPELIKSEQDANALAKNACSKKKGEKRYSCCYCPWSGVDNWCLKRHLNTHLKPFVCALCDYKAARSERLATHVTKVHNKKACSKCSFLAEDQTQLAIHLQEQHHIENRNIKVPNTMLRPAYNTTPSAPTVMPSFGSPGDGTVGDGRSLVAVKQWRASRQQGAARLFNYMEASDGSDQDDFHGKSPAQDFLEAGDVDTAADEVGEKNLIKKSAARGVIVTSPVQTSKHSNTRRKKVPKNKKSYNKENKKSKFECNICSLAFKSLGVLNEHLRQHSVTSLRSPLIVANDQASVHFLFDSQEAKDMEPSSNVWEMDENDRHSKRSRKQSQPKKIIQLQNNFSTDTSVAECENNTFDDNATLINPESKTTNNKTKDTFAPVQVSKQIDKIISKIVQTKEEQSVASHNNKYKQLCKKIKTSISDQIRLVLKPNKLQKLKENKKSENLYISNNTNRKTFTKLIKRLNNRNPPVVYRCKRCRLKFKRRFEIFLHYKYCKKKYNQLF